MSTEGSNGSADNPTSVARTASNRANLADTPASHKHAANLHRQAALVAYGNKDSALAVTGHFDPGDPRPTDRGAGNFVASGRWR